VTDLQLTCRTAGLLASSLPQSLHLAAIVKPGAAGIPLDEAVSLAVASCHSLPQTAIASLLICIDRN